jgi:hypothetical protein
MPDSTETSASSALTSVREDEPIVFDNPGPELDLFKPAVSTSSGDPVTRWLSTFEWMVLATRKGNNMTSTLVRLAPKAAVTITLESGSKVGTITLEHDEVTNPGGQRLVQITGEFDGVKGFDEVSGSGKQKWKPNGANSYKITRIKGTKHDSTAYDSGALAHDKIIVTFLPTPM